MIYSASTCTMAGFLQKDGYELQKVFCDVYSISATKLTELAAYVGGADNSFTEEYDLKDICFSIEQNMNKIKERLVIHANAYPYPSKDRTIDQNALAIWGKCGKIVKLRGGSFHPKLLLACFKSRESNERYYRLQVSTGNLTDSKSMDMAVVVEGKSAGDGAEANGKVLCDFYRKVFDTLKSSFPDELTALETTSFTACIGQSLAYIGQNILKVADIEALRFAYTYPDGQGTPDLIWNRIPKEAEEAEQIYVYSPFLNFDGNGITYLDGKLRGKEVTYHTNLTAELCSIWKLINGKIRFCDKSGPFFHAKVYLWKLTDETYRVWLGSANASENGWERNAEFAVGFDLKIRKKESIGAETDQIINRRDPAYWGYKISDQVNPEMEVRFHDADPSEEKAFPSDGALYLARVMAGAIQISAKAGRQEDEVCLSIRAEKPRSMEGELKLSFCDCNGGEICPAVFLDRADGRVEETVAIKKEQLPFQGLMLVRAAMGSSEQSFYVPIDGAEQIVDYEQQAESMLDLLERVEAIDAIPHCAKAGFSDPNDSVYRRLSAFLCSYSGRESACYRRIRERIKIIKERKDCFMSKTEQDKLAELEKLCGEGEKLWN